MALKDRILEKLRSARGEYLSGERLASEFGVSRNAVWKSIKGLEKQGYKIDSSTNRGYILSPDCDVLTAEEIGAFAREKYSIRTYRSVGSTNDVVKELAAEGAPEWTVVLAEEQTEGRGRYRRRFDSPFGQGIYLSVLLRPDFSAAETLYITTCAAVAVCEAAESVAGVRAEIKWVNDIFSDGKKICGILTEASFDVESGKLAYAVLGVGINVRERAFPEELKGVAGSLFSREECPPDGRSRLAAAFLDRFRFYYERIGDRAFYPEYKRRLFVLGRRVHVVSGNFEGDGVAVGLDENCFLQVRMDSGETRTLAAGEVSIKVE